MDTQRADFPISNFRIMFMKIKETQKNVLKTVRESYCTDRLFDLTL